MKLLNRYIGRTIFSSIMVVLLMFVALDELFAFIHELDSLKANYQFLDALQYILSTTPRRLYDYIPASSLIGCLVGLGGMAGSSELVVMRAAGVSVWRISFSVLRPVLVIVGLSLIIGEYIAPVTEQIAESRRAMAEGKGKYLTSKYAQWYLEGDTYVHINVVQSDGDMSGIMRYRFDGQDLVDASYAGEASFVEEGHWVVHDVERTKLFATHTDVSAVLSEGWDDTSITPGNLRLAALRPDRQAPTKLWEYAHYREAQGLAAGSYFLAFWQKVLQPLTTTAMAFLAISFIFGPLRSVTMGARVMAGVVTGLGLHYGQDFVGQLSVVYGLSPVLSALLPFVFCMVVGIWALRRAG